MSRELKGSSIVALPADYVVIDTETTGLDFDECNIIEISAIRYSGDVEAARFSSLVKPPLSTVYRYASDGSIVESGYYVDQFISDLTGITNAMLETAPAAADVIPAFLEFVGDSVLIGHNVSFDVNFLCDAAMDTCGRPMRNDHINTVRIARKVFPGMEHYRLSDVADACGVPQNEAHRAMADCETTAACYQAMRGMILSGEGEEDFLRRFAKRRPLDYSRYIETLDFSGIEPDEDHALYGKTVVFTGALERMPRKDALALVAQIGAVPSDTLTKSTNYLVVGNGEFVQSVKNGKSKKMQKAEAYALKGCDIHVISENAFWEIMAL